MDILYDNKDRIIKLAQKHGLKARWVAGDLEIISLFDMWLLRKTEDNKIAILHKNKNAKGFKYHEQRKVRNYYQAIDSISNHDKYKLYKCHENKVIKICDMIKNNNISRWQIS